MPPADLDTWRRVADDAELLRAAAESDPAEVSHVARLRKRYPADAVAVALELVGARRRATIKFPGLADRLVADGPGLEQASSLRVARHKAERFRAAGIGRVTDACCGVGGDAWGFVNAGLDVLAVDRDPVRAWMAGRNAGCPIRVADVGGLPGDGSALHLDPGRRGDAGRVYRLADHEPPPEVWRRLLARFADTAIKLSPAIDRDELAERLPGVDGELSFLAEGSRLVQAVFYTGRLAAAARSAVRLDGDATHILAGPPDAAPVAPIGRFLFAIHPAAERAELVGRLGLPLVHPKLGLLTADRADAPPPHARPWLTAFECLTELPFSADLRKLRRWLADHDAGVVEVKTRGRAVDPDRLQPRLRGDGTTPYTVFVLRFDRRLAALVTRRLA
ncbi:MAG: class I SAM-dependent methyltransferase [Planctomycetota bacterium]